MPLTLTVIDECENLPRFGSVAELLAADAPEGQCNLVEGSALRANAWHAGCVGAKAGEPVPDWWDPDPIAVFKPVQLFRVRDAYYAPIFGAVIAPDGRVMEHSVGQARFATPDLARLPFVTMEDEQPVLRPPKNVPELPSALVSMPWGGIPNYGHFLCDCMTSVAALLPQTGAYPAVFPKLKPWHQRHLELLGVTPTELDQRLYRISDVIFTSGMWKFLYAPNVNYRTLRDIQLRNKRVTDVSFSRIYISRSHITNTAPERRRLLSEAILEERLRALGFEIVTPEFLGIDEQIDLFRNADVIVAARGAALANVMYCKPDATIVEIVVTIPGFEPGFYTWIRDICAIVGCRWRPYFCAGIEPEQPVVTLGQKRPNAGFSFDVDVDELIGFVEKCIARSGCG